MKLKDIDFRVWDTSEKRFHNDLELSILPSCSDTSRLDLAITFAKNIKSACMLISNYEIELYTGLKDFKGRRVYQGDIVYFEYQGAMGKEVTLGVIAFENYCFCCKVFSMLYPLSAVNILRVVGNIHEDLDSLEAELVDLIDKNATEALIFELKHKIRFLQGSNNETTRF
ncbi:MULTISPECIES: YopX family protein [Helicobacter]|uniref:YopX family protein n=1 Tax=Helicobacter TaxID=209 RepID=UPI002620719F|nr:YopX family protein [Helicobacter sp. UBA3407]